MGDRAVAGAVDVVHNPEMNRFEVVLDGLTAVLDYVLVGKTMIIKHTGVPAELEGKGVGSALARTALDHVRDNGLVVAPLCPFVRAYIRRHPEYLDVVGFGERGDRLG